MSVCVRSYVCTCPRVCVVRVCVLTCMRMSSSCVNVCVCARVYMCVSINVCVPASERGQRHAHCQSLPCACVCAWLRNRPKACSLSVTPVILGNTLSDISIINAVCAWVYVCVLCISLCVRACMCVRVCSLGYVCGPLRRIKNPSMWPLC